MPTVVNDHAIPYEEGRLVANLKKVYKENHGPQVLEEDMPRQVGTEDAVVDVDTLRFTHDRISTRFCHGPHQGDDVHKLVEELDSGQVDPSEEPRLRLHVVRFGGHLFSLNNRRLFALKEHAKHCGRQVFVHVRIYSLDPITAKFLLSYTSTSVGRHVQLGGPGRGGRRLGLGTTAGDEADFAFEDDEDEEDDQDEQIGEAFRVAPSPVERCDQGVQTEDFVIVPELAAAQEDSDAADSGVFADAEPAPEGVAADIDERPEEAEISLLTCAPGEEFPAGEFPEVLEGLESMVSCRSPPHSKHPRTSEAEEAYAKFRRAVARFPRDTDRRRKLDALPKKADVAEFLVDFAEDRRIESRRVLEVLDILATCEGWHEVLREPGLAERRESLKSGRPHRSRGVAHVPRSAEAHTVTERTTTSTVSRARSPKTAQGPVGHHTHRATSDVAARYLTRLEELCCRGVPLGKEAYERHGEDTWKAIYSAVVRARRKNEAGWRRQLDGISSKSEVLEFVLHFQEQRKVYKKQAVEVLKCLHDLHSWRDALPESLRARHAAAMAS